jgi:hypothetical protein
MRTDCFRFRDLSGAGESRRFGVGVDVLGVVWCCIFAGLLPDFVNSTVCSILSESAWAFGRLGSGIEGVCGCGLSAGLSLSTRFRI